jgi:hypothetical protein
MTIDCADWCIDLTAQSQVIGCNDEITIEMFDLDTARVTAFVCPLDDPDALPTVLRASDRAAQSLSESVRDGVCAPLQNLQEPAQLASCSNQGRQARRPLDV